MWYVVKIPELITVYSDENPRIAHNVCKERNKGEDLYIFVNNDELIELKNGKK